MSLFLNLFLGHLIGDFILQPGRLVVAKREGAPGLLLHIAVISLATAAVIFVEIDRYWWVVLVAAVAHLLVERLTITARFGTSSRGLFVFMLDQVLHVLSLGVLAWVAVNGAEEPVPTFGVYMTDARLAALTGLIAVSFLGAIFAFEASNAVMDGQGSKGAILGFDWGRVGGMAERGFALFAALLTAYPVIGLVAFLPRAIYASRLQPQERTRQMLEASAGLALCVLAYALIAAVAIVTT